MISDSKSIQLHRDGSKSVALNIISIIIGICSTCCSLLRSKLQMLCSHLLRFQPVPAIPPAFVALWLFRIPHRLGQPIQALFDHLVSPLQSPVVASADIFFLQHDSLHHAEQTHARDSIIQNNPQFQLTRLFQLEQPLTIPVSILIPF